MTGRSRGAWKEGEGETSRNSLSCIYHNYRHICAPPVSSPFFAPSNVKACCGEEAWDAAGGQKSVKTRIRFLASVSEQYRNDTDRGQFFRRTGCGIRCSKWKQCWKVAIRLCQIIIRTISGRVKPDIAFLFCQWKVPYNDVKVILSWSEAFFFFCYNCPVKLKLCILKVYSNLVSPNIPALTGQMDKLLAINNMIRRGGQSTQMTTCQKQLFWKKVHHDRHYAAVFCFSSVHITQTRLAWSTTLTLETI